MLQFDCAPCTSTVRGNATAACRCSCPACTGATPVSCPTCHGMWNRVFGVHACKTCSGTGSVLQPCSTCESKRHDPDCSLCAGTGVPVCRACRGAGAVDVFQALVRAQAVENAFFIGERGRERNWKQSDLTELDMAETRRAITGWAEGRRPALYVNPDGICLADGEFMLTVHKVDRERFAVTHSSAAETEDYGKRYARPLESARPEQAARPRGVHAGRELLSDRSRSLAAR